MSFSETGFPGLLIFEPRIFRDSRGYFFESYNQNLFREQGIGISFVQDNQARSARGVLRGLHFQQGPYAQAKLIRVLEGVILDVVVDLRRELPTYGKVFSIELTAENKRQLLVPVGFAHGYSVLSQEVEVLYKCDAFYNKASERGIRYDDPFLRIDWKLEPGEAIVSDKDLVLPDFKAAEPDFNF